MRIQKSFQQEKATLYLVTTPIGNLSDMTPRAVETLKKVALIASEDTRVTKKLCNHFLIDTPLTSYHEHNKFQKTSAIIDKLNAGYDVALVSDAGMPLISDPGDKLVEEVLKSGNAVVPIPGANAALTALIASGLAPLPFLFFGFLERQKSKKKNELQTIKNLDATLIFYESPYRLKETLTIMLEIFGDRQVVIAREITKIYEEFIRGKTSEIIDYLTEVKGEVVLLVEGQKEADVADEWWLDLTLDEHVMHYKAKGLKTNEAIKHVAGDLKKSRQEIYKEYHHE